MIMTKEILNWIKDLAQAGYYTTGGLENFQENHYKFNSIERDYIIWLNRQGDIGEFVLLSLQKMTEGIATHHDYFLSRLRKELGEEAPRFYGEYLREIYNNLPIAPPTPESIQWAKSHWDALYEYLDKDFCGCNTHGHPDCVWQSFVVQSPNGRLYVSKTLLQEWSKTHPEFRVQEERRMGYTCAIKGHRKWQLSLPTVGSLTYDKWELGFPET